MIVERLTEEEWAIYEVFRNPVWCGEFTRNLALEKSDPPWVFTDYQKEFLLDYGNLVSLRCGRALGKTESILTKIIWHAVNAFFDGILFTVPSKSHLDPVFLRIQRMFRLNPLLKYWMDRYSVNSQSFLIKFLNGHDLMCRIAGQTGTGVNVVGLHTPIILLDEAAYYAWGTWVELQQVLNDWEIGHQILVSGVPDGRREKSVLYSCDTDDNFSHHRISSYRNPRFTDEREEQLASQFGGRDSQDFIRQVLGEHGTPIFTVFDRAFLKLEDYDVPVIKLYGTQLSKDSQMPHRVVMNLPRPPKYADALIFGVDLGYVQPTAVNALYRVDGAWYFLFRLELHRINYDKQEQILDNLDTKYGPSYIGLDMGAGGQGKSFYHHLTSEPKYSKKNYFDRIVPVEFGGTVVIGTDEEGKELKERVKPFSVGRLQQLAHNQDIVFSLRDSDLVSELERVTYQKTAAGNVLYKVMTTGGSDRGDDHNFAALLTFVMVLHQKYDLKSTIQQKKKLMRSRWLI